jgi:hypothetical protein
MKANEDGLSTTNLNVHWGEKQPKLRDTKITEGMLGPNAILNVGDMQCMQFTDGEVPWYEKTAPKYDKDPTFIMRNGEPPQLTNFIEGYVGKPKGIKQILWERGLWCENMKSHSPYLNERDRNVLNGKPIPDINTDMHYVLSQQLDFLHEKTALAKIMEARGHILLPSVKYHPEMAGNGIEYSWGQAERFFKKTNDLKAANLRSNVARSLSYESLPIERIWKYERKCRDYMRMYKDLAKNSNSNLNYEDLEKLLKTYKTHRNISNIMHSNFPPQHGK